MTGVPLCTFKEFSLFEIRWLLIILRCFVNLSILRLTKNNDSIYCQIILFIRLILIMAFRRNKIIFFYFFFEIRLIPVLIIIIGWGYQPERVMAARYLILYTVFRSLPLIIVILFINGEIAIIWFNFISFSFNRIEKIRMSKILLMLILTSGFLVKFPIYGVHLWLPKAHVEAPIEGSIILAALLLKLGGFGLILISPLLTFPLYLIFITRFRGVGGVAIAILALRQIDIKVLIAYSSVAHIRITIIALLSHTRLALISAILVIVSHGFSSPAIFISANFIYNRTHRRNMLISTSLSNYRQFLNAFWFVLIAANIAAPPSLNLIGELFRFIAMFNLNLTFSFQFIFIVFLSGAYSISLYSSTQHSQKKNIARSSQTLSSLEAKAIASYALACFLRPISLSALII